MPLQTTAESPVPVRTVLRLAGEWVGRLGRIWVEGQIAELTRRGGTAFLTLRDPVAAVSVRVICARAVLDAADPPLADETLIRAVAACQTPVVSAIGHEQDNPLLDLVADVRASTPTDAARRVVPDVAEQLALVSQHRARARRALVGRLDREWSWLTDIRSRPALSDPLQEISRREEAVIAL